MSKLGTPYKDGKIIGITPRPNLFYTPGEYYVVVFPDRKAEYIPREEIDEPNRRTDKTATS
jgi:hypothetical protein